MSRSGGERLDTSSPGKGAARWLACALVASATALVHAVMHTPSAAASGRLQVPDPDRARMLALGFEPVIADYYWLQALQLVGGAQEPARRSGSVAAVIDLVTAL